MTFTVAATTGDANPLTYQWQLDDTNLVSSSEVSGIATDTLTIANVQESNEGMYGCVVTNAAGNTISNPAQLTVREWSWVAYQVLVIFRACWYRNFSILVVHCSEPIYTCVTCMYMYMLNRSVHVTDGMWLRLTSEGSRSMSSEGVLHCTPTSSDVGDTQRSFLSRQNVGCTAASSWYGCPLKVVGPTHLKTIFNQL